MRDDDDDIINLDMPPIDPFGMPIPLAELPDRHVYPFRERDGGPVHPVHPDETDTGGSAGLSIRDLMAAHALTGLLSAGGDISAGNAAREAYRYADAMLKVREERQ